MYNVQYCTLESAHEMAIESGVVNAVTVITVFASDCFGHKISSPREVHAIIAVVPEEVR